MGYCTTLRLSCTRRHTCRTFACTWNKCSTGSLQLASCRQLQLACCRHVSLQALATGKFQAKRAGSTCTHTERPFPPSTVVAKCGGVPPYPFLIWLIASWWSHGAHTWSLAACFLEVSGLTGFSPCLKPCTKPHLFRGDH